MNTKNFLESTVQQARKLMHSTQQTSEDAFSYGRQKVTDGIANAKETIRKKKATPKIIDEAKEKYLQAVARFEMQRESGIKEASQLDALEQDIIRHDFVRFGHLYECAVNRTIKLQQETGQQEFVFEVPAVQNTDSIPASIKGIAAGGAAAATAVSMTALFGTASTGAAIAGLNGSAAVSATLAALGGGSLSAGGLGIAGGLAVTASAFVVPAIAIGTYFWSKDIDENYNHALHYREEVENAVKILDKECQKFKEAENFARTLHHDLTLQRMALGTMLDIFERSLACGHTKSAYELCGNLVAMMGQSMTLPYQMNNPTSNHASEYEQELLMVSFGRLQQEFGAYIASMDAKYRQETEEFLNIQNENLRKKKSMPIVRPIKDAEIRLLLEKTFCSVAQKEICIISPWISNRKLDELMEAALKRGVTVKLLYGLLDRQDSPAHENRYEYTKKRVEELHQRFARFGNRFRSKEGNTHAKLLIADELYYYIGSYHLLSFQGNYETEEGLHEEIGDYSENPQMIDFYKKTYFSF